MRLERLAYATRGLVNRLIQEKTCPCCRSTNSKPIDRKFAYTLERCDRCNILFRFPYESAEEMKKYYETAYHQKGLTTQLPNDKELALLLNTNFSGTEKAFSRVIDLLRVLNVPSSARILDYGANWGYGALQLQRAGYLVQAYEISFARASFGRKLGVHVETNWEKISGDFDVVYSSHVLEHTPNPLETLRQQISHVRHDGFLIAHTPNGSSRRREVDFPSFHKNWGFVHPVLLSDEFVIRNFERHPIFISSSGRDSLLKDWNRREPVITDVDGPELLIVVRNSPAT
jgi:SAM-dependent methyltransferase